MFCNICRLIKLYLNVLHLIGCFMFKFISAVKKKVKKKKSVTPQEPGIITALNRCVDHTLLSEYWRDLDFVNNLLHHKP